MIPRPINLFGAATSAALAFAAYLALVGHLVWQANAWRPSAVALRTELAPYLPNVTFSAGAPETVADFEIVYPETDESAIPTWYTWDTRLNGEPRRIVFSGERAVTNPGASVAEMRLLNQTGQELRQWSFWPGAEIEPANITFRHQDDLGVDVIVIAGATGSSDGNVARQYLAFSGDDLYLVRLEDEEGRIVPNCYYPCAPLGVLPDARGIDEWIAMLQSDDAVRILAALTYLGGEFHSGSRPQSWVSDSARVKVESIRVLRGNERIRRLIWRYNVTDQPWIREAAGLALREMM